MSDHNCIGQECPDHPNGPKVELPENLLAVLNPCKICGGVNRHHERDCPNFTMSCLVDGCDGTIRPTVEPAHFEGDQMVGDRLAYECRTCHAMWDSQGHPMKGES